LINAVQEEQEMPRFTQIQAVAVRVAGTGGQPHDVLEIIALGDDGKVYRYALQTGGGWIELK
jgi:hypothetical protein